MPPRKKIAPNAEHGFIGHTKSKPKPPKPYVDTWIRAYWKKRDDWWLLDMFTQKSTKDAILKKRENDKSK